MKGGVKLVLVDISVPVFFRDYDFKLREDVPVREIIRQICRILAEKEGCPMDETDHVFVLCSVSEKRKTHPPAGPSPFCGNTRPYYKYDSAGESDQNDTGRL